MNREEKMYAHVERCAAGTQSQKSYCQEQGLCFATIVIQKVCLAALIDFD
jgi:hypothetical protein